MPISNNRIGRWAIMPENNKKSFIMYSNYRKFLSMLSDAEIANLMRAIFSFVEDEEIPELDSKTDICFVVSCAMFYSPFYDSLATSHIPVRKASSRKMMLLA